MANVSIVTKVVDAVNNAGGVLELDNNQHADIISALMNNTKLRSELAVQHRMVVVHDTTVKPAVPLFVKKSGQKIQSKTKNAKEAVKASTPTPKKKVIVKKTKQSVEHEYILPNFVDELECLLDAGRNWNDEKSVNIRFVGPHGCGKTELAVILGQRCGFDRVYQINGRADMTSGDLLGEKVVEVDEKSMQSYIRLQRGVLEQAMTHGLEKDENGHTVLDKDGNVKVVGAPGLLFYDEYASAPAEVNIMLNQITQIPRKPGQSRELVLTNDGGRVVKGHPGFCVILSGNTNGRGIADESQMVYTAQDSQQDGSFLDRIKPVFQFGYNLTAEKKIMMSKLADDVLVGKLIAFVRDIRKSYNERNVETLLSTRGIVDLCDNIRRYRRKSFEDYVVLAMYRTLVSDLTPNEVGAWAEVIHLHFGIRIDKYKDMDGMWVPQLQM